MTPSRLVECLALIRWKPSTLAEVMEGPPALVDGWLDGSEIVPTKVASWLEALCFTHEAAELLKPVLSEAGAVRRYSPVTRHEHVPAYCYHLLLRLGQGPVGLTTLFGSDDEGAVLFLVTRELAERVGPDLMITNLGKSIGKITGNTTNRRNNHELQK